MKFDEATFLPVLDELRADAASKEKAQKAAAALAGYPVRSTVTDPAPAKGQRAPNKCKAYVGKAEFDEALVRWAFLRVSRLGGYKMRRMGFLLCAHFWSFS